MNYKILDLEYDILSLKYFKPRCLSLQNNSLNPKNLPLQILLFFLKKNYLHNIFINNHSTRRRRRPLFFVMTILIVSLGITRGVFLSRMRPFEISIDRFGDTDPSFWPKMKKNFFAKKHIWALFRGQELIWSKKNYFFSDTLSGLFYDFFILSFLVWTIRF